MEAVSPPSPQNGAATDIVIYLKLGLTLLYYLVYPVYRLVYILFSLLREVLRPIWTAVNFVMLPVTYLAAFLVHLLSLPFIILAKLETVYIFLGIAVVIGLSAGLVLALLSSFTTSTLQLDSRGQSSHPKDLRTLSAFRAARVNRKHSDGTPAALTARNLSVKSSASPNSPRYVGAGRTEDFLSSTILEEDDTK